MADYLEPNDRWRPEMGHDARPGSRRRRSFLAADASSEQAFVEPQPLESQPLEAEDGDLPLLTEVVANEPAAVVPPATQVDEAWLSTITADLVRTLEQQLASELPALVETSLFNAQSELRARISASLNLALRDFLARRQQLELPLDEPDPNQ